MREEVDFDESGSLASDRRLQMVESGERRNKRIRRFKILVIGIWMAFAGVFLCLTVYQIRKKIPSRIYFTAGEKQKIDFGIPATGELKTAAEVGKSNIPAGAVTIDLSAPVEVRTAEAKQYDMSVLLFGMIPIKKVDVCVIERTKLVPMGIPVGLYMQSRGVLIVGSGAFEGEDGKQVSPSQNLLKSGDFILKINGKSVSSKEEVIGEIEQSEGRTICFWIKRDGTEKEVSVIPRKNIHGKYKAGIWVRDNFQGVGTLTYVDGEGNFGAVGHGIADSDTGRIVDVSGGSLYPTEIVRVEKGKQGSPGEMTGRISYQQSMILGGITENSVYGVYGKYNDQLIACAANDPLPIGLKQEIECGPAEILCSVEKEPALYEVEITAIHPENDHINRGIELRVTDEKLLQKTGGIIQGMSGSPIIQNGKLIGAVTHVLISDPEKGYGIFIENMLENHRD